ncbi:hypothetical protein HMPREF9126_0992 [Parvimonas sp. oral taxon 110 str. F0139]|nr:hypothetical protein HMPREF9126_0992 [Parvimonas sp. oral taxon 110 str. F0139]
MRIIKTLFITFLYILTLGFFNIDIKETFIFKINNSIISYGDIELIILFIVEFFLFMVLIELILDRMVILNYKVQLKMIKSFLKKRFLFPLILLIRFFYLMDKIIFHIRPGLMYNSHFNKNNHIWNYLILKSIGENLKSIFKFLTSCYFSIPIVSVLIVTDYIKINREIIVNLFKDFLNVKINVLNLLSYLPTITALIAIIPVIFFFYFYSEKSEARKIVSESEKKYYKKVVKINEELSNILWNVIYDLSKNLDYVIKNQDLVIKLLVKESICNYDEVSSERFCKLDSVDKYPFATIGDLEKVSELCIKLCESKYKESLNKLYRNKYEFIIFKTHFYALKNYDYLNKLFYTLEGMNLLVNEKGKSKNFVSKEQYEKRLKEENDGLLYYLSSSLEMLYIMYRFAFKMTEFLHQTNNEYRIKNLFDRDSK